MVSSQPTIQPNIEAGFGNDSGLDRKRDRLRQARKNAGFSSMEAAAKALGVKPSTYTSHENGNRDFKDDVARQYAAFFKVSPSWLILGKETSSSSSPAFAPSDFGPLGDVDPAVLPVFMEAYQEARGLENELIGGPGPRVPFAKMFKIIYDQKLRDSGLISEE